jgi:hypothetical protein
MTPLADGRIAMLRHTVATLAYRGGKALGGTPAEFAAYGSRTPGEILAHVCDLFDWALTMSLTSQVVRFYKYVICPLCETK